ncbi:MAG: iron-sulfur cluster assembly accessory protein [Rhodoblastus sp.]
MSFEITPKAERFMRMMVMTDGGPGAGFRLAVSPGGCSGLAADMSVRAEPLAGDGVIQRNGFRLFVPAESRILLEGVTIDFVDSVAETKLVFHDPKATCCSSTPQH